MRAVLLARPRVWGALVLLCSGCFAFSGNEQTSRENEGEGGSQASSAGQGGKSGGAAGSFGGATGSAGVGGNAGFGGVGAGGAGAGGTGAGGNTGASGKAGAGGEAGEGAGGGGQSGSGGSGGQGGSAGEGGNGGAGGSAGDGGSAGQAGSGGAGAGMSGSSGQGGATGGAAGNSGASGQAGAGQGGAGGSAGGGPISVTGAEANKCPGVPVLVQAGETTVALNFTGSTDSYTSKSCSLPILANKDMVLALSAAESGMVNASLKLSGGTSATLYVRSECEIKASEITCKQGAFSQVAQVSFSLASGQVLYLLVEGAADSKSTLTLTFTPG